METMFSRTKWPHEISTKLIAEKFHSSTRILYIYINIYIFIYVQWHSSLVRFITFQLFEANLKHAVLHTTCYHQLKFTAAITAPQHLVCRVVQSLHTNHMQMSIIEVSICRCLHMDTSMISICIWLVCGLYKTLHTKCCGAVCIAIITTLRINALHFLFTNLFDSFAASQCHLRIIDW